MSGKSKSKKTPATTSKRRVTASARARISKKKTRKGQDLEGSYLTQGHSVSKKAVDISETPSTSSEQTIIAYLHRIEQANVQLMKRVDVLENKRPSTNTQSHASDEGPSLAPFISRQVHPSDVHQQTRLTASASTPSSMQAHIDTPHRINPRDEGTLHRPASRLEVVQVENDRRKEGVLPDLNALRQNQTVSQAVAQLVASYEQQARLDVAQGRQSSVKRSGRYNTADIVTAPPHLRWANEGFHAGNGKKRVMYDDLTLSQWVVGQLTNIHQMQDMVMLKQALMQVILAAKDATSLPWSTVRSAWATSMHEVEQGTLSWADTTQWAINRLSASQVAMVNSNTVVQNHQRTRTCRYYNEGSCNHEASHGQYKHVCSFCAKQGRSLNHTEVKCNFKVRSKDSNDK